MFILIQGIILSFILLEKGKLSGNITSNLHVKKATYVNLRPNRHAVVHCFWTASHLGHPQCPQNLLAYSLSLALSNIITFCSNETGIQQLQNVLLTVLSVSSPKCFKPAIQGRFVAASLFKTLICTCRQLRYA